MTGLLSEVCHGGGGGGSLQSRLPTCLWALTARSLPFGSQEDDPQPAQDTFTHGDTTAKNDDDGRDFHLDGETVTCKMTLVEMWWCPSLM